MQKTARRGESNYVSNSISTLSLTWLKKILFETGPLLQMLSCQIYFANTFAEYMRHINVQATEMELSDHILFFLCQSTEIGAC